MDNIYYLVRHGATEYNEQGRFIIIKNLRGLSEEDALKLKIDYCELIKQPESYTFGKFIFARFNNKT